MVIGTSEGSTRIISSGKDREVNGPNNPIGWCDYTWNPITGCHRGCRYCYARELALRRDGHFSPTFHKGRLDEPQKVKKPSKIFLCSMGELCGPWVPWEWQKAVIEAMEKSPWHTFQALTKFPEEAANIASWPENVWLGATVDRFHDIVYDALDTLNHSSCAVAFVSFEPILSDFPYFFGDWLHMFQIKWMILGALTQRGRTVLPENGGTNPEWVNTLLKAADQHGIPVYMKGNLAPIWEGELRKEWPDGSGKSAG